MDDKEYIEHHLVERIAEAKEQAAIIANGTPSTQEEFVITYRMMLSEHYRIPFFSEYFEERTLDEMIFEYELIRLRSAPLPTSSEVIKVNVDEAADVASSGWDDLPIHPEELKQMSDFMETGEFVKPGEPDVKE